MSKFKTRRSERTFLRDQIKTFLVENTVLHTPASGLVWMWSEGANSSLCIFWDLFVCRTIIYTPKSFFVRVLLTADRARHGHLSKSAQIGPFLVVGPCLALSAVKRTRTKKFLGYKLLFYIQKGLKKCTDWSLVLPAIFRLAQRLLWGPYSLAPQCRYVK